MARVATGESAHPSWGMLLPAGLDSTLSQRAGAFEGWAVRFVRSRGMPASKTAWLITTDRNGCEPRESFPRASKRRFKTELSIEALVDRLPCGHVKLLRIYRPIAGALCNARESGGRVGIVTTGTAVQQSLKIKTVRLGPHVDAELISEADDGKSRPRRSSRLPRAAWVGAWPVVG